MDNLVVSTMQKTVGGDIFSVKWKQRKTETEIMVVQFSSKKPDNDHKSWTNSRSGQKIRL